MKKVLFILFLLCFLQPGKARAEDHLTLMLDWFPNVDHVPIYAAREKGFFKERGLTVEIQAPSDSADPLKLAASGHTDIALGYEPQIIIARGAGLPLKAVGRLVGSPLTCLLFLKEKGISVPEDLEGKVLGYTVPGMMDYLLDAFVRLNGIEKYTPVNVGFSILQPLASGKVDAVMGPFRNYEPVAFKMEGFEASFFEIEKFCIPAYDELVFTAGEKVWKEKKELIRHFLDALDDGLTFTAQHPGEALELYLQAVPEASAEMEKRAFGRTLPYFAGDTGLNREQWKAFGRFALEYGMVDREVDMDDLVVLP